MKPRKLLKIFRCSFFLKKKKSKNDNKPKEVQEPLVMTASKFYRTVLLFILWCFINLANGLETGIKDIK